MHSEKIIKVLGAGLTTAALTLGAAAPALADVSISTPTVSHLTVNKGGNPQDSEVKANVTYLADDIATIGDTYVEFTNAGDNYEQKLKIWDEEAASLADFKATFDVEASAYMDDLYKGDWTIGAVTIKDATSTDDDDLVTAAVDKTITLNDGVKPVTDSWLNLASLTYDDSVSYVYNVSVDRKDAAVTSVTFTYLDPAGDTLEYTVDTPNGDTFTFNLATAVADLDDDYKQQVLKGDYELQSLKATKLDNQGAYQLETSVIDLRADNEEKFEEGDITGVKLTVTPMLRVYNPNSGEHVYTASAGEVALLQAEGWKYEGVGFYVPDTNSTWALSSKMIKINRLYDGNDHHYAGDGESSLLEQLGWKNEGVAFFSYESTEASLSEAKGIPVYRLYNPNASVGAHHYTTSEGERDLLKTAGWNFEGIGWMAVDTLDE